jgi:hypothetical protein
MSQDKKITIGVFRLIFLLYSNYFLTNHKADGGFLTFNYVGDIPANFSANLIITVFGTSQSTQ